MVKANTCCKVSGWYINNKNRKRLSSCFYFDFLLKNPLSYFRCDQVTENKEAFPEIFIT